MERGTFRKLPPRLDMNPMVDLAFLLVTFFMLATTFRTEEAVLVDVPTSQTEIKLPEKDVMIITVAQDGRVFFGLDGKFSKKSLLSHMSRKYQMEFTDQEINQFSLLTNFGMPMQDLKRFLQQDPTARREIGQPGIPLSEQQNELADWIVFARVANPRLRVAIKGDADTPYPIIKRIMDTLIDNNVLRFNLITDLEHDA